eukprot:3957615-Pleurochrysis_carterae.AAC.1
MIHCSSICVAPHLSATGTILSACLRSLTVVLSALCLLYQTDPPVEPGGTEEVLSASAPAGASKEGAADETDDEQD